MADTMEQPVAVDKPSVRIVKVTPSHAEQWLARNHEQNRRRRKQKVKEYAADMKAGRWYL